MSWFGAAWRLHRRWWPQVLWNWETASLGFFAYTAVMGAAIRRLETGARLRVLAGSAAGFTLLCISIWIPPRWALDAWLLPSLLLLVGYWTAGALFTEPMPAAERAFCAVDRALGIRGIAAAAPRWTIELLELAYAGVYALIPIALVLHLRLSAAPDDERFWTVILVTDYVCFAMLPWIRTRPPRSLEPEDPWRSSMRRINLRVLGAASIQVNTVPSGHAAEALVAALLLSDAPIALVAGMLAAALAVSAGAVLGRYHYATDAFSGWVVAVLVWWQFG